MINSVASQLSLRARADVQNAEMLARIRLRHRSKAAELITPAPNQATKLCRACCSSIPSMANKCVKCNSLQDWQRFVTGIASVLGVAVASASVLAFALPIWRDRFHVPHPRPHLNVVDKQSGFVVISVSNDGDAPMSVGDAWFHFENQDALLINPDVRRIIIKQNDIALLKFKPTLRQAIDDINDATVAGTANKPCYISVEIFEPSGAVLVPQASLSRGYDCGRAAFSLAGLRFRD